MKKILMVFTILLFVSGLFIIFAPKAEAGFVSGYWNRWGSWTDSYYRSRSNALKYDNYGYKSYQPAYNSSYYYPTKNYGSSWYTPSYSDSNYYSGRSWWSLWK